MENEVKEFPLEAEFTKNPECSKDAFYELKEWLVSQKHLPQITDSKLFQFFFSCFYNLEKTKKCIESFYILKKNTPEFFTNRDVSRAEVQRALRIVQTCTLPVLTPTKQYRVTYQGLRTSDATDFDFAETAKLFFMAYDAALYSKGTARGHIIVFDYKNVGFRHILKCSMEQWKKIIKLTQEALPVRKKTLHVLNTNYFVYKFAQILRPFIMPDIFKTIHLHRNLEELYEFIPQQCLPSDYGGDLESVETYSRQFEEQMLRMKKFFEYDETLVVRDISDE